MKKVLISLFVLISLLLTGCQETSISNFISNSNESSEVVDSSTNDESSTLNESTSNEEISSSLDISNSSTSEYVSRDIGMFYKLGEAYENNFLSRDDLLNIAYNYNGKINVNDADFVAEEISINELDETIINEIKETHLDRIVDDALNPSVDGIDIFLSIFFPNFNSCRVTFLKIKKLYTIYNKFFFKYNIRS